MTTLVSEESKKWENLKEEDLMKVVSECLNGSPELENLKNAVYQWLSSIPAEETEQKRPQATDFEKDNEELCKHFAEIIETLFNENGMFQISKDYDMPER